MNMLRNYHSKLISLERKGRRRLLSSIQGLDFCSNDYLALANHPRLKAAVVAALERNVPLGASGSRLLRGNHPEHEALEAEAAVHFNNSQMLYFGSGYMANMAALSTLPQRGDVIVHDELIHASVHAGIRASRATAIPAPHNDAQAVEDRIRHWRDRGGRGAPWIVVESLYSMDGDQAPLNDLYAIAARHDGFLYIDEAHATGVYGDNGTGLAAAFGGLHNVIMLHSCGKALGGQGALLGADTVLCDYLINRASSFIFTTAPSPLQAAAMREALKMLRDAPQRRTALSACIAHANKRISAALGYTTTGTQIIPIAIGNNARSVQAATLLQANGFDIRAIRPPTVPYGTARLRIAITLNVDLTDIDKMVDILTYTLQKDRACTPDLS